MKKPRKVLLDNSVRSLARGFARPISVPSPYLGSKNRLALFEISHARNPSEAFKQKQLEALPSIASLAEIGKIQIFTSVELSFEALKNAKVPHFEVGDLLANSIASEVPVPLRRSGLANIDPFDKGDSDHLIDFTSWLLNSKYVDRLLRGAHRERLEATEIDNLNNIHILHDICKPLAKAHFGDAFHLWTAAVNDIDYFLTTDKKFKNAVTQNGRKTLKSLPIFPTDLLSELEVTSMKPLPFRYGKKYYYSGLEYD